MTDTDLKELQEYLLYNPDAGKIMQGTGGLRKVRWARNKGKSGGVRALYIDFTKDAHIYFITVFGKNDKKIKHVAWCTGAAQDKIDVAIDVGADLFISGEISEQIPALAKESGISFISAGHHATERYGVQALGQHLSDKFDIVYKFIEIDNSV